MRIALVSPYSWSYPGGVTSHIQALAEQFQVVGHNVRVFAPYDPADSYAKFMHRGSPPRSCDLPDYVFPLGRTVGIPANGSMSNLTFNPGALWRLYRELKKGDFDVVHLHEPIAPMLCWSAHLLTNTPLVGTFHSFSENTVTNNFGNLCGARLLFNRLAERIAVSEAAAWTGRRFFGGRYTIIPNGVHLNSGSSPLRRCSKGQESETLRLIFVGQAVERKGLAVLLRAFEALRDSVSAELTVVGANTSEVTPLVSDLRNIRVLGRVSDAVKQKELVAADLLCAPSLGGESFGMVLTEAFAAGTPVVASDIPGYRDVVRDGTNGILVPAGEPQQLAEALRALTLDRPQLARLQLAAWQSAARFAWPHVATEVLTCYERVVAVHQQQPVGNWRRFATRACLIPVEPEGRVRPQRLPKLSRDGSRQRLPSAFSHRRVLSALAAVLAIALSVLAVRKIGVHNIQTTILQSSPLWVLLGLGLMGLAMIFRAFAWRAILQSALPGAKGYMQASLRGTVIGVLMSATLPGRLGEPSRALVVSRRLGGPLESFPVVIGTIVSQAILNVLALVILGVIMFSTVGWFDGRHSSLIGLIAVPIALVIAVAALPVLLRGRLIRLRRIRPILAGIRGASLRVRSGLHVFKQPRYGVTATIFQLTAWGLQWVACFVLFKAVGLNAVGIGAAAAVLFAVNVTAVLPATPSNVGVFQVACVAILGGAYGVGPVAAFSYGVVLQAVELATAVVMGMPALVAEGLSWRDVRARALYSTPVVLPKRVSAKRLLQDHRGSSDPSPSVSKR